METYYETLNIMLEKSGFKPSSVNLSGHHIMGQKDDDKYYICHFDIKLNNYSIDDCKKYDNFEDAMKIFIRICRKDMR